MRVTNANANVAAVQGSIPASSDTVESEGAVDEAGLYFKNVKKSPPHNFVFVFFYVV